MSLRLFTAQIARSPWWCEQLAGERVIRGTLGDIAQLIADADRTHGVVLVVRALAAKDFRDSALYDPDTIVAVRGGALS